jgi:long-chain acyl-CoA synthetase
MKLRDPLLNAWSKTVAWRDDAAAVLDERGAVLRTFDQIQNRSREFEDSLASFRSGDVVAIQIGNHAEWPSVLLACLRRSVVAVPLDQSMALPEREIALKICRASGLIVIDAAGEQSSGVAMAMPAVNKISDQTIAWGTPPPSLLKLTSGTTAAPRAIRFRSEQLLADCNQICETMGITDADINFGVIPISHSYGFSNLLTPLVARGVTVALSNDRLPRAVIHNLDRSGATIFPGMPLFYQAFVELADLPPLEKLRLCISAGAPLPPVVATKFLQKFRRRIHSFYGSSECGGICYNRKAEVFDDGFVGEAMENVSVEPIVPGEKIGQIRVRSGAVGDGYFPEPEGQKLGCGTFVPDDLLMPHANGWKIVGRVSDLINVAGKKVNPIEIETELLALPDIRQAVVFGRRSASRNEEVAACVVANAGVSESDLLQRCRRRLSGWQVPKRIFIMSELPVNERGKINRRDLATRFADR